MDRSEGSGVKMRLGEEAETGDRIGGKKTDTELAFDISRSLDVF